MDENNDEISRTNQSRFLLASSTAAALTATTPTTTPSTITTTATIAETVISSSITPTTIATVVITPEIETRTTTTPPSIDEENNSENLDKPQIISDDSNLTLQTEQDNDEQQEKSVVAGDETTTATIIATAASAGATINEIKEIPNNQKLVQILRVHSVPTVPATIGPVPPLSSVTPASASPPIIHNIVDAMQQHETTNALSVAIIAATNEIMTNEAEAMPVSDEKLNDTDDANEVGIDGDVGDGSVGGGLDSIHDNQTVENHTLENQATPTGSIRSIGSLVCRICHNSENPEKLVSPCLCKGSLTYVHIYCLERWISTSRSTMCELCQFQYNTEQTLRYTCLQSLRMWYSRSMSRRALQEDCQMFSLLTLVVFGIIGTLLVGIQYYFLQTRGWGLAKIWTKGWLIFFLLTTVAIYFINVYMIVRSQLTPWYRWWQSARDIKLILENRKPFKYESTKVLQNEQLLQQQQSAMTVFPPRNLQQQQPLNEEQQEQLQRQHNYQGQFPMQTHSQMQPLSPNIACIVV